MIPMAESSYVQRGTYAPGEVPEYSYCESATATGGSWWHIRKVKDQLFLTGGVDTPSLCGHVQPFGPEKMAFGGWDLNVKITDGHQRHACAKCVQAYQEATRGRT